MIFYSYIMNYIRQKKSVRETNWIIKITYKILQVEEKQNQKAQQESTSIIRLST